jgi:hypothetical protein
MDSACRGYPESTPNFLHKDIGTGNQKIQIFNLDSQYPPSLLLLLLLRRSFFNM